MCEMGAASAWEGRCLARDSECVFSLSPYPECLLLCIILGVVLCLGRDLCVCMWCFVLIDEVAGTLKAML